MSGRIDHNALVLARMRISEYLGGDEAALEKLVGLPYEVVVAACLEALEAPDGVLDT